MIYHIIEIYIYFLVASLYLIRSKLIKDLRTSSLYKKVYSWFLDKSKFDFQSKGNNVLKLSKDYHPLPLPSLIQIRLKLGKYNYNKVSINTNTCILSLEYRPANQ